MATSNRKYTLSWKVVSHDTNAIQGSPERYSLEQLVPTSIRYSYDVGLGVIATTHGPLLVFKSPYFARDYLMQCIMSHVTLKFDIVLCATERASVMGPVTSVLGSIMDIPGPRRVPAAYARADLYNFSIYSHAYSVKRLLDAFWKKRTPWTLPVALHKRSITKAPAGTIGVRQLHVLKSYLPGLASIDAQRIVMGDIQLSMQDASRDTYALNDASISSMIEASKKQLI